MNFTNFIRAQSLALAIVVLTVALAIKAGVLGSIQFYVVGVVGLLVIFHQVCLILIPFSFQSLNYGGSSPS